MFWKFLFILILHSSDTFRISNYQKLKIYRKKIDFIDDRIADLIDLRFQLCSKIAHEKKKDSIEDRKREEDILSRVQINHPDLSPQFINDLWTCIFEQSKQKQVLTHQNNDDAPSSSNFHSEI